MIYVNLAPICSQQEFVVCNPDRSKENSFFEDCRHKLAWLVKNKYFSIVTQNQHKSG